MYKWLTWSWEFKKFQVNEACDRFFCNSKTRTMTIKQVSKKLFDSVRGASTMNPVINYFFMWFYDKSSLVCGPELFHNHLNELFGENDKEMKPASLFVSKIWKLNDYMWKSGLNIFRLMKSDNFTWDRQLDKW